MEIEFLKQDQKIKEATQRIPESNIKILSSLLVSSHLENFTSLGIISSGHNDQEIIDEIIKMKNLLRNVGFTNDEIENLFNEILKKNPWMSKYKGK